MGSLIIVCFILAILHVECSKAEGIDCSISRICDLPKTNLDFLCPKMQFGQDDVYFYMSDVRIGRNSITGYLMNLLDDEPSYVFNRFMKFDMCDPPRKIINEHHYFLARATFSSGRYHISSSCRLVPLEYKERNLTFEADMMVMTRRSVPRPKYCNYLRNLSDPKEMEPEHP